MSGNQIGAHPLWRSQTPSLYPLTDMAIQGNDHTHDPVATPAVASGSENHNTSAEDIKTFLRDRIPRDQPDTSVYKGYVKGAQDFQHHFQQYISLSHRPAAFSDDFPDNDDDLRQLAKGLSAAMLNFADAIEAGQKSTTRIYQLSPYEVELKSWELLFVLRDVQRGQIGLPGWGKLWAGEDFDSFMGRYNDAVSKLRVSKSMVSSLFDEAFTVRLALAPASELKKKLANKNNNARRAVELAMVREGKQKKQDKSAEGSDHAGIGQMSRKAEDSSARAQLPGSKRLRPQDHSADLDDDKSEGVHPNKRPRSTNSYAASEETQSNRTRAISHGGHSNDAGGSLAHDTRNSRLYDEMTELVEIPGLTPASERTDFSSLPSSRSPLNGNSAQASFDVDNTKTNASRAFSPEYDALGFDGDAFHVSKEDLASDAKRLMNEPGDNALLFGGYDKSSSEAFSFNPGLDYSPNFLHGATGHDTTQGSNGSGANLNIDFEEAHEFPGSTWRVDEDGRNSEAVTLTPGDSNEPIVDNHTLDVNHSSAGAVVSDDLLGLNPNDAVCAFYNEDGTFDKFGMMKTI